MTVGCVFAAGTNSSPVHCAFPFSFVFLSAFRSLLLTSLLPCKADAVQVAPFSGGSVCNVRIPEPASRTRIRNGFFVGCGSDADC